MPGQPAERGLDVGDDDGRHADRPGAEDRGRTGGDRRGGEVVAVDVLAGERDEQPAGLGVRGVEERRARSR